MKRQGFTLIELLVVIAIIAILAAILFPVFAQARVKAKTAACLSNTKQLALGLSMYADDYDDAYPKGAFWVANITQDMVPVSGITAAVTWADVILPYVKAKAMYACPSRPQAGKLAGTWGGPWKNSCGFGFNEWGWNTVGNNPTLSSVANPSDAIILTEIDMAIPDAGTHWFAPQAGSGGYFVNAAKAHNYRMNFAFCDGHAKALKPRQTISPKMMWNCTGTYPFTINAWDGTMAASEEEAVAIAVGWTANTLDF
ncbi:MAG: prepilin-type N-terminal cleavage/methylation domain-containing protein [Armatimonadota bacterium]